MVIFKIGKKLKTHYNFLFQQLPFFSLRKLLNFRFTSNDVRGVCKSPQQ